MTFSATARICCEQVLGRLLALLARGDLLRDAVLLGAERLELGERLAAFGVEGEDLVEVGVVALLADRAADEVGVFADECQVQHGASEPPESKSKSA